MNASSESGVCPTEISTYLLLKSVINITRNIISNSEEKP